MAETTNWKIVSPDGTSGFNWVTHLGQLAGSVETALNKIQNKSGTTTDRTAYSGSANVGDLWFDTTLGQAYMWDGATWRPTGAPKDSGWQPVTSFQNGFSARAGEAPQYRKIDNVVWLRGQLYRGTAPEPIQTAFVLPSGYRPPFTNFYQTVGFALGKQEVYVEVESSGNVKVMSGTPRGENVGFPLTGMSFLVD